MRTSDHQEELQRDSKAYGPLFSFGQAECQECEGLGKIEELAPSSGGERIVECPQCKGTGHNHSLSRCEDSTTGQQLKEKGLREVSEHNENWMEDCLRVAKWFVFQHGLTGEFTGEDIRLYCVTHGHIEQPKHPNAWGALINTLIKRKIIVPTGEHRQMKDKTSHARSTPVYKAS